MALLNINLTISVGQRRAWPGRKRPIFLLLGPTEKSANMYIATQSEVAPDCQHTRLKNGGRGRRGGKVTTTINETWSYATLGTLAGHCLSLTDQATECSNDGHQELRERTVTAEKVFTRWQAGQSNQSSLKKQRVQLLAVQSSTSFPLYPAVPRISCHIVYANHWDSSATHPRSRNWCA
jgi:hypothetical protein